MSNLGKLGADLLRDLSDKLAVEIMDRLGVDEEVARRIGEEVAGAVADDWGGQSIYVPMDVGSKRAARNESIWKEFDGNNQDELAAKHGLSVSAVYRILKAETERRRIPQRSLFEAI